MMMGAGEHQLQHGNYHGDDYDYASFAGSVLDALVRSLNSDKTIRAMAEDHLLRGNQHPRYAEALASIASASALQNMAPKLAERQAAGVTLKNYVEKYWIINGDKDNGTSDFNLTASDTGLEVEPTPASKEHVKHLIIQGLSDPNGRIRALMAATATRIVNHEGVERWPQLLDALLLHLRGGQPDRVDGAMSVLSELVEDVSVDEFSQMMPVLIPEVYRVFSGSPDYSYSADTRCLAVSVFRKCIGALRQLQGSYPEAARSFLAPMLDQWAAALKHSLLAQLHVTDVSQISLMESIFSTIETLTDTCPALTKLHIASLLPAVWDSAKSLLPLYLRIAVSPLSDNDSAEEEFEDLEAAKDAVNAAMFALFALLQAIAERPSFKPAFSTATMDSMAGNKEPTAFLVEVVSAAVSFAQATESQIEAWSSDPNSFVAEEEELQPSFSVRFAVSMLLEALLQEHSKPTVKALIRACEQHVQIALQQRAGGEKHWWKELESTLYVMSCASVAVTKELVGQNIQFNMDSFVRTVVGEAIVMKDLPLLQGRALLFPSAFMSVVSKDLMSDFANAYALNLAPSVSFPAKVCAMRSVSAFARNPELVNLLRPYTLVILEALCTMMPLASDDLLFLLLDTLINIVRVDVEATTKAEGLLAELLISVWMRDSEDQMKNDHVLSVFAAMAKNSPQSAASLQNRLLPSLTQIVTDPAQRGSQTLMNALVLLTHLARSSTAPLPAAYVQNVFPSVLQIVFKSRESQLLLNCQDLLRTLVSKDIQSIVNWSDETGKNGLSYLLDIVSTLLDPTRSDNEALHVGELIVAILVKGGSSGTVSAIVPDLLAAMVRRLAHAKLLMCIQSLILAFARVAVEDAALVVGLLDSVQVEVQPEVNNAIASTSIITTPPLESGLSLLLRVWCERFDEISGFYSMKLSSVALAKILMLGDARVDAVSVRGRLKPTERIVTRSQSKKRPDEYIMMPFPIKAMMLLITDYEQHRISGGKGISIGNSGAVFAAAEDEESGGGHTDDADDEVEDVDEWEDDFDSATAIGGGMGFGNDWLDADGEDDEDEVDPELAVDFIVNLNPTEFMKDILKGCLHHSRYRDMAEHFLNPTEKSILEGILAR